MSKKSVVFLINSLAGGGAERVMMRLVSNSYDRQGAFDFHLVLLDQEEEAYPVPEWITVHRLDSGGRMLASVTGVWRLLRELRPDVVLSFLTRANIANVIISKLVGYKAIISERTNTSAHHDRASFGQVSKWLIRQCYSRAEAVIAVASGIADDLAINFGVRPERTFVISNPVDADSIRELSMQAPTVNIGRPYFVGVGRFVPSKNFALLLESFAASSIEEFDLVIMGQGPLEAELTELADRLGLAGRVHFPGFLPNPFPIISRAHAYVLPSNGEGFPNGLVEAMVTGIPVISTDCRSGPAEILNDTREGLVTSLYLAKYGILVPPNDKEAMISALKHIVSSTERERLGAAAASGVARFGLTAAVACYWEVIIGVLNRSEPTKP